MKDVPLATVCGLWSRTRRFADDPPQGSGKRDCHVAIMTVEFTRPVACVVSTGDFQLRSASLQVAALGI
jgi:hypothetical protein